MNVLTTDSRWFHDRLARDVVDGLEAGWSWLLRKREMISPFAEKVLNLVGKEVPFQRAQSG
jgi:hypothetical protein